MQLILITSVFDILPCMIFSSSNHSQVVLTSRSFVFVAFKISILGNADADKGNPHKTENNKILTIIIWFIYPVFNKIMHQ
ncbi:hypothetical protein VCRA2112E186_230072 [Vibrio crassostreae]|nr:hypothetical protein VCRA2112E186_230072 [Vibrio crassostreae]CAK2049538.1 hypothetical protein VCRA2110O175_350058 [Vibrio crassostreae]CAK2076063.1 hypothetical protein VCRA2112O184_390026 [Vibrio crassostreae]CAK2783396.1 hypothetical protein VCRA2120O249_230071 [Vibrio crassostreae]CAK2811784.1 hypothetical protein VCRA2113O219_250048 [Vibrio crassostreae]